MSHERIDQKDGGRVSLTLAFAVAGLLVSGASTPLLGVDTLSACCDTSKSCGSGTFIECGFGCYCESITSNKCAYLPD